MRSLGIPDATALAIPPISSICTESQMKFLFLVNAVYVLEVHRIPILILSKLFQKIPALTRMIQMKMRALQYIKKQIYLTLEAASINYHFILRMCIRIAPGLNGCSKVSLLLLTKTMVQMRMIDNEHRP